MNIYEIAKLANVSHTTVSRVFNGGYVSEATRAKVNKVLIETGYTPSIQAKSFRLKKSYLIGIIVPALDSEIVMKISDNILEQLANNGYQTIIMKFQKSTELLSDQLNNLKSRGVDGLIVFLLNSSNELENTLKKTKLPVVTIGPTSLKEVAGIVHDDTEAFKLITQSVIDAGYREIGALFPSTQEKISQIRLKAIKDTLNQNNITINEDWIISIEDSQIKHGDCGYLLGKAVLNMKVKPKIFIIASDRLAFGIYMEFKKAGIRIPEDIALTGAGNNELGTLLSPKLTTIDINQTEIAKLTTELLLHQIDNSVVVRDKITVKPTLILRESILY